MSKTSQLHSGLLLAVLLGGVFMGNVDIAIVNIAMPSIRTSLHATGSELVLVASGYTLVYALMLIPGARLGEMAGYRRIFLLGTGVFTISSLILSLAPNALVLILTRAVQGAGAALMAAQVLTGIQLNFEGHERARAIGWYTAVLSGSAVIGQVLGGVLIAVNLFGAEWRSVFLINVPIGLLGSGISRTNPEYLCCDPVCSGVLSAAGSGEEFVVFRACSCFLGRCLRCRRPIAWPDS